MRLLKSILLKLILASKKIIDGCSHKLFSKLLETTKSFWCFVFVTLFNLQGAHRANLSRQILMIAQHFSFVKNFFQVFSNFFVLSSAGSRRHHLSSFADDLIRIPQALRFVKHFFQVFQTSFSAQLGCSLVVSTLFGKVFALSQSACLY